jgi:hypothetical protein
VVADHDPDQDERRDRGEQQQPAHDRVDLPAAERAGLPVDHRVRVVPRRLVPGEEQADAEQEPAHRRDELSPSEAAEVHVLASL